MVVSENAAPHRHGGRRLTDRLRSRTALVLSALFVLGIFFLGWAVWWEPRSLDIHAVEIPIEGWPEFRRPLKIAALTDIHVGSPYIGLEKLKNIVEETNAARPDAVFLLGDYVILGVLGGNFVEPEPIAEELGKLKAPLGVYAVLGNHDWWYDGFRITKSLENAGIVVLEDETAEIDFDGKKIYVAGLADDWTRRPAVAKTFSGIPAGAPILALTHNPDLFPKMPPFLGVLFAGHTHGGQVRLPFMGRPIVPSRYRQKYAAGLIRNGHNVMYVSTGLGTSILPVRFRVPPEILLATVVPRLSSANSESRP